MVGFCSWPFPIKAANAPTSAARNPIATPTPGGADRIAALPGKSRATGLRSRQPTRCWMLGNRQRRRRFSIEALSASLLCETSEPNCGQRRSRMRPEGSTQGLPQDVAKFATHDVTSPRKSSIMPNRSEFQQRYTSKPPVGRCLSAIVLSCRNIAISSRSSKRGFSRTRSTKARNR